MYIKLQVSLWTFILYILYCQSELTELHQKDIGTYINNLCHIQDGCDKPFDSMADAEKYIGNTCCKGCPCENNCSTVRSSYDFEELTECLKPMLYEYNGNKRLFNYTFVTKEPKEGCRKSDQLGRHDVIPSCSSDIVTALGNNFYPVYSYDKRVNFKNEFCALCHGANDLVHWEVYSVYNGRTNRDLEKITYNFRNFNSSDVFTWFIAPNRESRDFTKICFVIKDKCKAEYRHAINIPDFVNMTTAQVIEACEYGPRFLFMIGYTSWFKNVFCAFCNGAPLSNNDLEFCEKSFFSEAPRSNVLPFTYLLKRDFIYTELEKSAKEEKKMVWACSNKREKEDQADCREIICPLLQIRLHDGRCDYPFETLTIDKIVLWLNLSSTSPVRDDLLSNITYEGVKRIFEKDSPWSSFWNIISIFKRIDTTKRLEFLVTIGFDTSGQINIKLFKDFVTMTLSKVWAIDVGMDDSISLFQSIHVHGVSITNDGSDIKINKPLWTRINKNVPFLSKAEQPSWVLIFSDRNAFHIKNRVEEIHIDRTFLCSQILLQSGDYIFENEAYPLFLNQERTYVYPGEYYVYGEDTKGDVIASCFDDSRFKNFELSNAASHTRKLTYPFKILLLVSVGMVMIRALL